MDFEDRYVGVGHSLMRLAALRLKMKALPPDDNPTEAQALSALRESVEEIEDVEDLSMVMVHLMRTGAAFGFRPTVGEVAEGTVVADVVDGLELLRGMAEADQEACDTFRLAAAAVSCVVDYTMLIAQPFISDRGDVDQEHLLRSALLVAENSARGVDDATRARVGATALKSMAEHILSSSLEGEENGSVEDPDG